MPATTGPAGELFGQVSDLSPHGLLVTDHELVVRGWNGWLAQHTRKPAAAVLGRPLLELYPDLRERRLDEVYQQALAGHTLVLSHKLHRYLLALPPTDEFAASFEQMQQSFQVAPITRGNMIVGTVTVINDVTERVAREQELQHLLAQEQQARVEVERAVGRVERLLAITTALSSAVSPVAIAEVIVGQGGAALGAQAGLIARVSADQQALEIVYAQGYPAPTLAEWQRLPLDLPSPLTRAVLTRTTVLAESRQDLLGRFPLLMAVSDALDTRALAAVPLLAYDRLIGVLGLSFAAEQAFGGEDRAFLEALAHQGAQALERARLYEAEHEARARAEGAVKVRDQFLSIAAHEFRTPLTSLLGNAQLLQRRMLKEGALPERHQRLLNVTIDQGQRLSRMVSMMLDISRLESGRFALEHEPLDLDPLLRRVVEELQATSASHTIIYVGTGGPLIVDGDDLRLEQVFYNLLANAIKYSPGGSEVRVEARRRGAEIVVAIIDQGIGISPTALPQLFQQFYRSPEVEEAKISGVGIGLYIVKEIVTRHGGEVSATSVYGQGSTFTVRLPATGR